jgi:hypothetical protein
VSARLLVDSDATDHPRVEAALTGEGTPATLYADPPTVDFGQVDPGETRHQDLTVHNRGAEPVTVAVRVDENAWDAFSLSNTPGGGPASVTVSPGVPHTFTVRFAPTVGGPAAATFLGDYCGPRCGLAVPLQGALRAPRVDLAPAVLDFGRVERGQHADLSVAVLNHGNASLVVTGLEVVEGGAAFSVQTRAPVTVAPGESAPVVVRFAPVAFGRLDGRVRVSSNDPRTPHALALLTGTTPGSDLVAIPPVVDFGVLRDEGTAWHNVLLVNRGDLPASVLTMTRPTEPFALEGVPPLPQEVGPGGTLLLTVRFQAADLGTFNAELVLGTDQVGRETLTVPVAAARSRVACAIQASTQEVAFGGVRVGQQGQRSYALRNAGSGPCVVGSPGLSPYFTQDDSFETMGAAATLQPGEETQVFVRFSPRTYGPQRAVLQVNVQDLPPVLCTARGTGTAGEVSVNPTFVDFGAVPVRCGVGRATATLMSQGITAVSVGAPTASPAPPFGVAAPMLPGALPPGQAATLQLTFAPTALGIQTGEVRVVTHNPAQGLLVVGLRGEGVSESSRVSESFTVSATVAVDVLFLVDGSGSMWDNQQRLSENARRFIEMADFRGRSVSFHLGVTTVDVTVGAEQGRLVGAPAYLTDGDPQVVNSFMSRVLVGTNGSGVEQGLEAVRLALSPPVVNTTNTGFLRPEAGLAVVVVSDEDDQSTLTVAQYVDFLRGLKAGGQPVVISAITGGLAGCGDPSDPAADSAYPAPRYAQAVQATGGIGASLCDPDWGATLRSLGAAVFRAQGRFALNGHPRAGSVTVTVNGVATPAGWRYDAASNTVLFDQDHLPAQGDQVVVSYAVECGS